MTEIIDPKHPEWQTYLDNSVAKYKTTIHHFEVTDTDGMVAVKPVYWNEADIALSGGRS